MSKREDYGLYIDHVRRLFRSRSASPFPCGDYASPRAKKRAGDEFEAEKAFALHRALHREIFGKAARESPVIY